MSDAVKVRMATAASTSKGVELKMLTTAGPEVTFLLDDLAIGLLGLTLQATLEERHAAAERDGDSAIRLFGKDGSE